MTPSHTNPDWQALLQHSGWVRALARTLVADPTTADDVEQAAWLQAAQSPPRHTRNLKSWWAQVVRSAAGMQRRRQRPTQALPTDGVEDLDSPAQGAVAERMEMARELVDAVAALPEPYATTIYLRFFEELTVREVAARQGVPVNTAQTRIRRGLDKLRQRMGQSLGSEWRSHLLLIASPLPATATMTSTATAALTMSLKTKSLLAATVLLAAVLGTVRPWESPEGITDPPVGESVGLAAEVLEEKPVEEASSSIERTEQPVASEATAAAPIEGEARQLQVQVLDAVHLNPVPHAEVIFFNHADDPEELRRRRQWRYVDRENVVEHFGESRTADEHGRIDLPFPGRGFEVAARADGKFAHVFRNDWEDDEVLELQLLEVQTLDVRVLHADGQPAAGIHVGLDGHPAAYADFPSLEIVTDEEGRATFTHAERVLNERWAAEGCTLAVAVPSVEPLVLEFPAAELPQEEVLFRLPPTARLKVLCRDDLGNVIPDGIPIVLQTGPAEERFQMQMARGGAVAYVRDGAAIFEQVGIGTDLALHCSKYYSNEEHTMEIAGPIPGSEEMIVEMILPAAVPPFTVRLVDELDTPIAEDWYTVWVEVLDAQGKSQSTGQSAWVNAEGELSLEMNLAQELQADGMDVMVKQGFDAPVGDCRISLFHLELEEGKPTSARMESIPEFGFGDRTLVGGRCVDPVGRGVAGMTLHLRAYPLDGALVDGIDIPRSFQLEVVTDADGRFRFLGQADPARYRLELYDMSSRLSGMGQRASIPFDRGQEDLEILVQGQLHLAGRLLVDDPAWLEHLELQVRVVTEDGTTLQQGVRRGIERPSGRFRLEDIASGDHELLLLGRESRQVLARWEDFDSGISQPDGTLLLPDWDLREQLHAHRIEVTGPDGSRLPSLSVGFPDRPETAPFLHEAEQPLLLDAPSARLTVGAVGMQSREVHSNGEVRLRLEAGIPLTVRLTEDVRLPDGFHWSLGLRLQENGRMHRHPSCPPQTVTSGQTLHFVVPEEGRWFTELVGRPTGEEKESGMTYYLELHYPGGISMDVVPGDEPQVFDLFLIQELVDVMME